MKRGAFLSTSFLIVLLSLQARAQNSNGNDNPTSVTGSFNGEVTTGGMYDPYTRNVKRVITDMVVPGCVGAYPLKVTRYYNSRGNSNGAWTIWPLWTTDTLGKVTAPDGRVFDWSSDTNAPVGVEETGDTSGVNLPDGGRVVFSP